MKEDKRKKVAIIGTAGVPARYGGFETLTHHLVKRLHDQFDLTVYCSQKFYSKEERVPAWNGAKLVHLPLNANGMQSIPYDIISIIHALFYADVLLVLGVSGGIVLPLVKLFSNKKIIVNIDGLEWRRDKWHPLIKKFLKLSEYMAVKFSDADIADNLAIKRYTALYYKTLSFLVAYGGDHVQHVRPVAEDYEKYPFLRKRFAFKVCRIEPENNVHKIIEAFARQARQELVIVGNWMHSDYGMDLFEKYAHLNNIHLLNPIYDQAKLDVLRCNCSVYIHGHSAGGTNPSLVEAMNLGLPIIAFDVPYNRATTEDKGLYFKDAYELIHILENTSAYDFNNLAERLKSITKRRYTWDIVAKQYAGFFKAFDYAYKKKDVSAKLETKANKSLIKQGLGHMAYVRPFYE